MRSFSFFATGEPKGQPRPRAFARKFGSKWSARVFDPGTAEGWKSQIAVAAREHITEPLLSPVKLEIVFNFQRPRSHFTKKGLRQTAPRYHTAKPDIDNAVKAIMDALTQLGAWHDDKQVVSLSVRKEYAVGASIGGAAICVSEVEDLPADQIHPERRAA